MKGITLMKLIISIGVLVFIASTVIIALDPVEKVGKARDEIRTQAVLVVAQALTKYAEENQGDIPFTDDITTDKKILCTTAATLDCDGDSQACLAVTDSTFFDNYLRELPVDPLNTDTANTGYYISKDNDYNVIVGACTTHGTAIAKTITVKEMTPIVVAFVCTGYNDGSYCWYGASLVTESCDDVCVAQGTTCSTDDWNDDTSCTVTKAVVPDSCTSACSPYTDSGLPGVHSAAPAACAYRSGAVVNCASAGYGGSYKRTCACDLNP